MAKNKFKDINQMDLFAAVREDQNKMLLGLKGTPGSLNMGSAIREALYEAIKGCPMKRYEIAAKMSELTDADISKAMLDAWTAESKEDHRFPLEYIAAFCQVTGCTKPLELVCRPVGVFALGGPEVLRSERQKLNEQIKRLQAKAKEIDHTINVLERGK